MDMNNPRPDKSQGKAPPLTVPRVTVLTVIKPASVGKRYYFNKGKPDKHAIGNITEAIGRTAYVPTAAAMLDLLEEVTNSTDQVIVNGVFRGGERDEFHVYSEDKFRKIVKLEGGDPDAVLAAGRLYKRPSNGELIGARKEELIQASSWVLLDADEPIGFKDEWRGYSMQQRLELLETTLPGISEAERVELRGSSARVLKDGGKVKMRSHAWLAVDVPEAVEVARVSLLIRAVLNDVYFLSPRMSRSTGEIMGEFPRTVIDTATWTIGRLNYDSLPSVEMDGYSVIGADLEIINPGNGPLVLANEPPLSGSEIAAYQDKTGSKVNVRRNGASMAVDFYDLKRDTPIEVRGVEKPLSEWLEYIEANGLEKLRCEAPFRDSQSEAALIRPNNGDPFVYDVGTGITYRLSPFEGFDAFKSKNTGDNGDTGQGSTGENGDKASKDKPQFVVNGKGLPAPIVANVLTELRSNSKWAVALDKFAGKEMLMEPLPDANGRKPNHFEPRPLDDGDIIRATEWFQRNGFQTMKKDAVADGLSVYAADNAFDPLADHL